MVSSLAKEARAPSTISSSKICSNGRSRMNECSNGMLQLEDRVYTMQPIYHRDRQGKWKLLQLQGIWGSGKELQG